MKPYTSVAKDMKVSKSRIVQLKNNVHRKLRWPCQIENIEKFINEDEE